MADRNENQVSENQLEKVLGEVSELKRFCVYQQRINEEMQSLLKAKTKHEMTNTNTKEYDDSNATGIRLKNFMKESSGEDNNYSELQGSLTHKWNKGL